MMRLNKIKQWLGGKKDGIHADLTFINLKEADLRDVNLSYGNLAESNLQGADLSRADLCCTDMSRTNLNSANLTDANLYKANLRDANLRNANLIGADLISADLSGADMSGADLTWANLRNANLSGAKGILSAIDYMQSNCECTNDGYIVYKIFNELYSLPKNWEIKPGSVLSENVNFDRTYGCGCGINVATWELVQKYCDKEIWRCLIRWKWLSGVCVPYNTDGTIRCERVELLEVMAKRKDNKNA